jgi:hypothetical protein
VLEGDGGLSSDLDLKMGPLSIDFLGVFLVYRISAPGTCCGSERVREREERVEESPANCELY